MAVKEPNARLDQLILEANCSRAGLAKRVNQLGLQHGLQLRYDKTAVARWIKDGAQPRGIVPHLIAEALGAKLGRSLTLADLGMADEEVVPLDVGLTYASTTAGTVQTAADLWRCDVDRRDFLINSAFTAGALSAPSLDWLINPPDQPTGRGERHVGGSDVAAVRAMCEMFTRLDNSFGGGHARSALVQYLDSEAGPMLRGTYTDKVGRDLFSAVAELTMLAGWMAYDTCQHGLAQRYFIQALRLTQVAGDRPLGAFVLADAANQAAFLGDGPQTIKLARAGAAGTAGAGTPRVAAILAVREARGHSLLGEARECRAALRAAETAFDRSTEANEPPWTRFFGEAEMAAQFSYCFRDLERPAEALRYLDVSLAGLGPEYIRSQAFCQAVRASALVQQGEVEQACEAGSRALAMFRRLRSTRAHSYVRDLQQRLEPYRSERAVMEFNEQATELTEHAA
jgi:hypothetical protein